MKTFIGILIACLIVFSCTEKKTETTNYVQEGEIQLAKPRIAVSSTMIDSFVTMKPEIRMENLSVFYEVDGKKAMESSSKVQTTVIAKEAGTFNFRAYHPDWKPSDVTEIRLYKKGFIPNKIRWQTTASEKYKGQGETTLINHKKASLKFQDVEWTGFDTIAKATVSFPQKTYIKSLTIGYLVDPKSWIFPPEEVILHFNDKESINLKIPALTLQEIVTLDDVKIPIEKEINTLNILVKNVQKLPNWHPGKGTKAWLFMDEWIFN